MAGRGKTRGERRTVSRRPVYTLGVCALLVGLLLCLCLSELHVAGHCGGVAACCHVHGKAHHEATETGSEHEPSNEPDHDESTCLICQWLAGRAPQPSAVPLLVTHTGVITHSIWLSRPVCICLPSTVPCPRGPPSAL